MLLPIFRESHRLHIPEVDRVEGVVLPCDDDGSLVDWCADFEADAIVREEDELGGVIFFSCSVGLLIFAAIMKTITVVAAVIRNSRGEIFVTQRGYGEYKDWWEVPGGKPEPGETLEQALRREIMEELDTEISVDSFITTIDYDYPSFHLTMHCYWCSILSGNLELKEHEAAKWLAPDELESVNWLPADLILLPFLR